MYQIRFTIYLLLTLSFLPGSLAAQGPGGADAGAYVILNAQYGSDRSHVDVTARLKDLARRDRPFRINHDSMNADPDHGRTKELRIFARGPNGRERMFEFRDGSVVDGASFRSWGRGDWGDEHWNGGWNGGRDDDAGEYVILSAQYGSELRHVDVTDRLREMARQDRSFRLNYGTFDVDPDEGHAKSLRIFARGPNGRETMFEFRDNSLIDGAMFRGWGGGEWGSSGWSGNWNGGDEGAFVILSAQYGSERRHVDVTQRLREMARQDRSFRLNYRTFDVDPDEGHAKELRIFARGPNGREHMFEYRDGSVIDGAQFRGWGRGEWGNGNDRWSGRWEGEEREERERERER
ncbi:MAG TPA: hypothetical protein VKD23_07320 [Terriglobales bacterium]|nr:hypothetical protein [Terriglobales bacterium]